MPTVEIRYCTANYTAAAFSWVLFFGRESKYFFAKLALDQRTEEVRVSQVHAIFL